MQVGDRVIVKQAFWNGPSSAREKTTYEIVKVTERTHPLNMVNGLDLRGPDGEVKQGEPANHYEILAPH